MILYIILLLVCMFVYCYIRVTYMYNMYMAEYHCIYLKLGIWYRIITIYWLRNWLLANHFVCVPRHLGSRYGESPSYPGFCFRGGLQMLTGNVKTASGNLVNPSPGTLERFKRKLVLARSSVSVRRKRTLQHSLRTTHHHITHSLSVYISCYQLPYFITTNSTTRLPIYVFVGFLISIILSTSWLNSLQNHHTCISPQINHNRLCYHLHTTTLSCVYPTHDLGLLV